MTRLCCFWSVRVWCIPLSGFDYTDAFLSQFVLSWPPIWVLNHAGSDFTAVPFQVLTTPVFIPVCFVMVPASGFEPYWIQFYCSPLSDFNCPCILFCLFIFPVYFVMAPTSGFNHAGSNLTAVPFTGFNCPGFYPSLFSHGPRFGFWTVLDPILLQSPFGF